MEKEAAALDRTYEVIGAAMEVHSLLGPGLLEQVYEECLVQELVLRGIPCRRQVPLPISYKGVTIDRALRLDLLVDEHLIVEVKSVASFDAIHQAQLLTYLRLAGVSLGLLINFNVPHLRHGVRRLRLFSEQEKLRAP